MSDKEKKKDGVPAEISEEGKTTAVEATTPAPAAPDAVAAKLAEVGITDGPTIAKIKELGAESVDDLASLQEGDLTGAGVPVLKARKAIEALTVPAVASAPVEAASPAGVNFDAVLPSVPDDGSWLNALRSGGILKIDNSTVISAIRAALADRFGLYDIPAKLVAAMEAHIDTTEEQVTDEFWKLRKTLTKKAYGDLFAAIEGLDGTYVTDGRKNELLRRINSDLWPSITNFNEQLKGWHDAWIGSANPAMMMAAVAAAGSGGGMPMPPGMMAPPDCSVLRDAAETVNDKLNRTFRGTGVQITAALAFEANQIKESLVNPRLPILCGVESHDLLLKKLGVAVPATYPRMEQNLSKFVLAILDVHKVAGGNEELGYFGTLFMLGSQIPWSDIDSMSHSEFDDSHSKPKRQGRPRGIGS